MYLHLGQDTVIKMSDIIGIFDLDTSTISKKTKEYLARAEKSGKVINVTYELPKTFIVTKENQIEKVYISQISSTTLLKRAGFIEDISNI